MRKWILPGILTLAFFLRVIALNQYPAGFTPDEASFGYDAYSLLKTGKDQWGHALPLFLESFGDFKPPLYAYLTIPSVAILGLTKFATRLPNVLFGTVAVYVVYLLVKEILRLTSFASIFVKTTVDRQNDNKTNRSPFTVHRSLAFLSAFFLAISPWHIMLSRGAFEANLTTFFLPLGMYLFFRGIHYSTPYHSRSEVLRHSWSVQGRYFAWSAFIFGLNLFSYHSAKLVTPLVVLFLTLVFRKDLLKIKKKYLSKAVIIFALFLGLTGYTLTQGAARRAQDVSIFNDALEEQASGRLEAINSGLNSTVARLIHNKYRVVVRRFINNYKQYFSYKFLFSEGPAEATYGMIPGMGILHSIELLALIGFAIALIKNKTDKFLQTITFWIVVAPIPAALTMGVGYAANRVSIMMPAIQIASAVGFVWIFNFVKQKFSKQVVKLFVAGLGLIVIVSTLSFIREYFINPSDQGSKSMLSGNLESAYWLAENTKNEPKIVVSTKLSEPHIYVAFANKWDPKDFQKQTKDWERYKDEGRTFLDQLGRYNLGKYIFTRIDDTVLQNEIGTLFVGKPEEFSQGVDVIKRFNYFDGNPAVLVGRMNNLYAKKNN